ncbi:MAG: CoA-binding protein, partial [Myxococcota bacterium]|nr:CoA-binding protein [Myxococcota bacterium]
MSLRRVLDPRSVAVIGASRVETKRGYQSIRTLTEDAYAGAIYPVNPREESVLGLRCYPDLAAIDGPVDLALITTPARTIPAILEQCADKGVAGAVIIAGGFGEMGPEGKALEKQLSEVATRRGIRVIGPNTSGMINVNAQLNLVGMPDVPRGEVALLSQSGNMALALVTEAARTGLQGFSCYVGVGNEAGIRFHEYLEYFRDDPRTRAVAMYVEGMHDGRSFLEVAQATTPHKPVVMLKSGRSERGRSSAGSHSGALAGSAEVARSALRRTGVVLVDEADKLFPCAEALASLPPLTNNRIAILADGGGHATIAADALTDMGVEIPALGDDTQARLRSILPPAAAVANPIDVAGATDADPTVFADVARILLEDEQVGGLLMVGLFGGYGIRFAAALAEDEQRAARELGALLASSGKPIVVHSMYDLDRPPSLAALRAGGIPVHGSVEVAS